MHILWLMAALAAPAKFSDASLVRTEEAVELAAPEDRKERPEGTTWTTPTLLLMLPTGELLSHRHTDLDGLSKRDQRKQEREGWPDQVGQLILHKPDGSVLAAFDGPPEGRFAPYPIGYTLLPNRKVFLAFPVGRDEWQGYVVTGSRVLSLLQYEAPEPFGFSTVDLTFSFRTPRSAGVAELHPVIAVEPPMVYGQTSHHKPPWRWNLNRDERSGELKGTIFSWSLARDGTLEIVTQDRDDNLLRFGARGQSTGTTSVSAGEHVVRPISALTHPPEAVTIVTAGHEAREDTHVCAIAGRNLVPGGDTEEWAVTVESEDWSAADLPPRSWGDLLFVNTHCGLAVLEAGTGRVVDQWPGQVMDGWVSDGLLGLLVVDFNNMEARLRANGGAAVGDAQKTVEVVYLDHRGNMDVRESWTLEAFSPGGKEFQSLHMPYSNSTETESGTARVVRYHFQ